MSRHWRGLGDRLMRNHTLWRELNDPDLSIAGAATATAVQVPDEQPIPRTGGASRCRVAAHDESSLAASQRVWLIPVR